MHAYLLIVADIVSWACLGVPQYETLLSVVLQPNSKSKLPISSLSSSLMKQLSSSPRCTYKMLLWHKNYFLFNSTNSIKHFRYHLKHYQPHISCSQKVLHCPSDFSNRLVSTLDSQKFYFLALFSYSNWKRHYMEETRWLLSYFEFGKVINHQ